MTINLSIDELHKLYASGDAKPSEITNAVLERIEPTTEFYKLLQRHGIEAAHFKQASGG